MLIPLSWLKQYVDVPVPVEEYVYRMVMTGSEVEGWEIRGAQMEKVVVGQIMSLSPHPNADRLQICAIDAGGGETLPVVTGAPNVFVGARVPVALPGSMLPGGIRIKPGKLRGELSMGMLCSGKELGITDDVYPGADVDGILILTRDEAPGTDIKDVLGFGETIIDFKTLANRPDCMSVLGMARETSVTLDVPLRLPATDYRESEQETADYVGVSVLDSALCPRYMGRIVTDVRIAPSPEWMRRALESAGVRPINNIVDITNYVMLEMGQPLHAFDFSFVKGGKIIVRRARPGEKIITLDGKERTLTDSMLVIADAEKPVAVAGIMGGEYSGIFDTTRVVMLESANFLGSSVRTTSRALGLRTESSARFEKGLPPQLAQEAMNRAMHLIEALGAGKIAKGAVDVCAADLSPRVVETKPDAVNRLLGQSLSGHRMRDILRRLSIEAELADGERLVCRIPHFRQDIETTADIAEEIQRIHGYHTIPSMPLSGVQMYGARTRRQRAVREIRERLAGFGLFEGLSYSFMSPSVFERLGLPPDDPLRNAVRIKNPLGEEYSLMRTTLVPGLLDSLMDNASRQIDSIRLFEIGNVFTPRQQPMTELPQETLTLGVALMDERDDFYTLKGIVEALCDCARIPEPVFTAGGPAYLHPGRSAICRAGERIIAVLGELAPAVAASYDLETRAYLAELNLDALLDAMPADVQAARPIPKYPAVSRDLAVTAPDAQPVGPMLECIRRSGGELLESASLFDIYRGEQLGQGIKSVAFSLVFRSPERTLTDEEVDAHMRRILSRLSEEFGAQIRG